MKTQLNTITVMLGAAFTLSGIFMQTVQAEEALEKIEVISDRLFTDTSVVSPSSKITAEELKSISVITVEDAISHEPSLIVRKRFIGDPNGVIGIRGSNMFQGSRNMVFADGMPLHYHLQTRWSGSPRWSLVSPNEIDSVEIIYGPYSAEYAGNAMGGVVNITTATPTERKFTLQSSIFSQDYDMLATDETFNGGKLFLSYEDKFDDFTIFTSYNRLLNNSQPMSQYRASASTENSGELVSGAITGIDERGRDVVFYGDSGSERAATDLLKVKLGYDFGNYQLRSSVAYEKRERDEDRKNNFPTSINGNPIWGGTANIDGTDFSIRGSNFENRNQERDSLLIGFGLSGLLGSGDWIFDTFYSNFEVLDDEEIRSGLNPNDPGYSAANESFRGRFTEFDDTGWQTFDFKVGTDNFLSNENQRISLGVHWDNYELNIIADDYNAISRLRASDELDGNLSTGRSDSGGEAYTYAAFFQYGYKLSEQWDVAFGLRYEDWTTENGYSGGNTLAKRSEDGWSPKFSIGYFPRKDLTLRYSIARAIRFPIIEELYRNDGATSSGSVFVSDPNLNPERGIFQNFSVEKHFEQSTVKLNLFYDQVDDVIFNQSTTTDNGTVSTALPTEEVTTKGAEFIFHQKALLDGKFDIRFNLNYIDTEITENILNPSTVGNDFPRMPNWRSNLIATYQLKEDITLSTSLRYASNSSGRLDNQDTVNNVFGAHDDFLFWGAKANWQLTEQTRLSVGLDNITDEEAFVFHPWPSRTIYVEALYQF